MDASKDEAENNIKELVNKFKSILNYVSSFRYSKESISILIKSIGLTEKQAVNVVENLYRLKRLKKFCWILGVVISLVVLIIILKLPFLDFIREIPILVFTIPFVIFLLFILEGILITRMPESFYLNLIDINKDKVIENNQKINSQSVILKNYEDQEKKELDQIKNSIKYLMKQHNLNKQNIQRILNNYNIDTKISEKFIDQAEKELINVKKIDIPNSDKITDLTIRLSLSKIHESFINLNKLYSKIYTLQKDIYDISKKQEKMENITKLIFSKDSNKIKNTKNKNINLKLDELKDKLDKKNTPYYKYLEYLYNLVLPHVKNYTEKEFNSLLLYKGFKYEVTADLINMLKDNNISFKKNKKDLQSKIIDKINDMYDKISNK
jgi:hypothetical protein